MRGLSSSRTGRRLARRLCARGRDRGAVAALIAIMLGSTTIFGMGAVVVDVGRLYAEREQLQSGADAAAWAMAQACARRTSDCSPRSTTSATLANANAADSAADVTVVCGSAAGLPACPAQPANRTGCLGQSPASPYVEVHTRTRTRSGSTILPGTFARALAGPAYDGTAVGACARVAWGAPRSTSGLAVTFSLCEWSAYTNNGATLWSDPTVALPPASAEIAVYLHTSTGAPNVNCPAGPSGWDRPGGFGWLDDSTSTCTTTVSSGGTYGGNTGNSSSQPCRTALSGLAAAHKAQLIPIYDQVRGQGANTTYSLAGFAEFVLTGYKLSGFTRASWLTGRNLCSGSARCLYGYFVRGLVPTAGAALGGADLGAYVLNLSG